MPIQKVIEFRFNAHAAPSRRSLFRSDFTLRKRITLLPAVLKESL